MRAARDAATLRPRPHARGPRASTDIAIVSATADNGAIAQKAAVNTEPEYRFRSAALVATTTVAARSPGSVRLVAVGPVRPGPPAGYRESRHPRGVRRLQRQPGWSSRRPPSRDASRPRDAHEHEGVTAHDSRSRAVPDTPADGGPRGPDERAVVPVTAGAVTRAGTQGLVRPRWTRVVAVAGRTVTPSWPWRPGGVPSATRPGVRRYRPSAPGMLVELRPSRSRCAMGTRAPP
jgi:hypothetical protein